MRVTLQLSPDQASAIVTAWSRWEQYDDPPIYRHRCPPEGQSDWTHGDAGYMAGPLGHRWLTDDLDLSEVIQQADGTWIFRYSGQRNAAARFFAEGIDWESLPVLDYETSHPEWPWWRKTDAEERARWLAFTKTDFKAPVEPPRPDEVIQLEKGLRVVVYESEPYYVMTYYVDDTPVATQFVTDYELELREIKANLDFFIEQLKAFEATSAKR